MFELHLVFKYLRFNRTTLSSGLIALASTAVIALVVALLLTFFSITRQMESRWLEKITALSAPLRITPSENYTQSYYYQADGAAESSNFTLLSLGEKAKQEKADPLSDQSDDLSALAHLPQALDERGSLRHLARELKEQIEDLDHREMGVAGGGMRLRLLRDRGAQRTQSLISAVPYFFAVDSTEAKLGDLFIEPTLEDYDNTLRTLLGLPDIARTDNPQSAPRAPKNIAKSRLEEFVGSVEISALKTGPLAWPLPQELLPTQGNIPIWKGPDGSFYLEEVASAKQMLALCTEEGLSIENHLYPRKSGVLRMPPQRPVKVRIGEIRGDCWHVEMQMGSYSLSGFIPVDALHIAQARLVNPSAISPYFATVKKGALQMPRPYKNGALEVSIGTPIILPKNFRDKGVRIGDSGYLSYQASGLSGTSEQRITSYVAGFYDPGLSPLASRLALVPREIVLAINSEGIHYDFDQTMGNAFLLWPRSIGETQALKAKVKDRLAKANLLPFFHIESFEEYELTRPFLQQFRSDRQLFSLISVLVLLVACCNVFSFLILLVNDKRTDIAILRTMGASKAAIARIFCLCALVIGVSATLLGTLLAALFLAKLPALLALFSFLQNHPAFSPDLFGVRGALAIDLETLAWTWAGVPLLSLVAGAVAARKAAGLMPTEVLRS